MSLAPTPARLHLPQLTPPPATIIDFLCAHFPHIAPETWRARIVSGTVRIVGAVSDSVVSLQTPYRAGVTVTYFREVETELEIPFAETVIYEDDRLLVADKPHFLTVTPSGGVVNECLLFRLQRRIGNADLTPAHRLDRDTAGLVLFIKRKADRASYTQLFATGKVERKYLAIAQVDAASLGPQRQWTVADRIEPESGSFRMKSTTGEVNASTKIELLEVRDCLGHFALQPSTGKKHQLRLHMMALGFPILNDPFYPELTRRDVGDFSRPLQLLASELAFTDPATGARVHFQTMQRLHHSNPGDSS